VETASLRRKNRGILAVGSFAGRTHMTFMAVPETILYVIVIIDKDTIEDIDEKMAI
jgi:hypothetical protein